MATGAAYYFNIHGFNKKAITPDFPAMHAHYTFNRNKVVAFGGINAPASYHDTANWLTQAYKNAARKNARVWSRFILNLPYDLTHDQRVDLVRTYLADVAKGRAQVAWAIHGDTKAPHAHAIFVDRDVETGELVARLSDAGSAYRLRKMWEDACNRALAWAGSEYRISRWGKESEHHKELNTRARLEKHHKPHLASTALHPVATTIPLAEEEESVKVDATVEKTVDAIIKQDVDTPSIAAVVAFVVSQVKELDRLQAARQAIVDYRAAYTNIQKELARTSSKMEHMQVEMKRACAASLKASQEEARHKTISARFWQIFSPAKRQRAKAAETAASVAAYNVATAQIKANTLLRDAQALQAEQKTLTEKANALKSSLAIYGTDEDLDAAEKMLVRTIQVNVAELTAAELSTALVQGHITPEEHRQMMRVLDKGQDISY